MARYVVEWVCRSREEREAALPLLVIGHDDRGGRIALVDLPIEVVGRRVLLHPDSLRDRIADWEEKLGKPLHMYDRKSERYIPVASGDPQWLTAACAPTLDDNYFCTAVEEREGTLDEVLAAVVGEMQERYNSHLVS